MTKIVFRYGTMGSSKTANALMTLHSLRRSDKNVVLIKPKIDTRDGVDIVKSKIGLQEKACIIESPEDIIFIAKKHQPEFIIADEAQFFSPEIIDELVKIADKNNCIVFAYGLRSDFKAELFPGSKRLFEVADSFEEIKSSCSCGNKAIINARFENGNPTLTGDQVLLGRDESYEALCRKCWTELTKDLSTNKQQSKGKHSCTSCNCAKSKKAK